MSTKSQSFPIYDKRDGAEHHALAFKTLGEVLGLRWNAWLSRGCSGFDSRESGSHERELRRLIREAQRKGERILGASLSNYGVEIAVESYCGARPATDAVSSDDCADSWERMAMGGDSGPSQPSYD